MSSSYYQKDFVLRFAAASVWSMRIVLQSLIPWCPLSSKLVWNDACLMYLPFMKLLIGDLLNIDRELSVLPVYRLQHMLHKKKIHYTVRNSIQVIRFDAVFSLRTERWKCCISIGGRGLFLTRLFYEGASLLPSISNFVHPLSCSFCCIVSLTEWVIMPHLMCYFT